MEDPNNPSTPEKKDEKLELEKLQVVGTSAELFFRKAVSMVTEPRTYFAMVGRSDSPLDLRTWLFAVISITGSTLIFQLMVKPPKTGAFAATYAITLLCWFFYGMFAHLVCKIFRGRAKIGNSISGVLQVTSFTSLISMLAAFLYWNTGQDGFGALLLFLVVEALLNAFYFGASLSGIHGFGIIRMVIIGILLSACFAMLNFYLFLAAYLFGGRTINISPS